MARFGYAFYGVPRILHKLTILFVPTMKCLCSYFISFMIGILQNAKFLCEFLTYWQTQRISDSILERLACCMCIFSNNLAEYMSRDTVKLHFYAIILAISTFLLVRLVFIPSNFISALLLRRDKIELEMTQGKMNGPNGNGLQSRNGHHSTKFIGIQRK